MSLTGVAPSLLTLACSMALVPALLITATALVGSAEAPTPAVAAGMAAYHRGDFATALAILKPIVYDVAPGRLAPWSDPWATAYLAQMFRRGEGTQADWPLSCALFTNAWGHTRQNGPAGIGSIPFVEDGIQEVCLTDAQSQPEVMALRQACFLDGVTRQTFVFDGATWIVVDRRGFHIDLGGEHNDVGLEMRCHDVMLSLTESDVSIPDRWSTGARVHYLELFKWTNRFNQRDGVILRELHWMVYAVRGSHVWPVTDEIVLTIFGGAYPSLDMPPGIRETAVLQLNTAGQVEWLVKGPLEKRGIIPEPPRGELPSSQSAVLSRTEQPAGDFAVRFNHRGCHFEYLDMFNGTFSAGGAGPVPFALSKEQRASLFKAIVVARIFELPPVTDAGGGEPADNYEIEVRNGGTRRIVSWSKKSADTSLTLLVRTVLNMLNPNPGDGCSSGPPKVR
jgi:hypothetical protein